MEEKTDRKLIWISGSKLACARLDGQKRWLVVKAWGKESIPLGVRFRLVKGAKKGDPRAIPSRSGIPLPNVPLPAWLGAVFILAIVGFAIAGLAMHDWKPTVPTSEDPGSWWMFLAGLAATIVGRAVFDALNLAGALKGNSTILRLGPSGLTIDPAAWAVLDSPLAALVCLAYSPAIALLGLSGWAPQWLGAGLFMGATLSFALHSCPLLHGPLASLLGDYRGISDFPGHLRLAIAARFLPLGQRIGGSGSAFLAIAALSLFIWAYVFTLVLQFMGSKIPVLGLASMLWSGIVSLLQVGWVFWTIFMIARLVRSAWTLRGQGEIEEFDPPMELVEDWKKRSALLQHVPELGALKWTWFRSEARALLVKFGDVKDRHFHAIESGAARVIGRDQDGDLVHFATLREGSAFGEIALLEHKARMADVVAIEPMVTASLDGWQADTLAPEVRNRLRQFVLTSQAFDRCSLFAGMSESAKERWLANGRSRECQGGEVVILEGAKERWMGLVVQGHFRVDHQGHQVATLGPDTVIGEMGFLEEGTRRATITTTSNSLLWIWEPAFLVKEVQEAGLTQALKSLAHERERSL